MKKSLLFLAAVGLLAGCKNFGQETRDTAKWVDTHKDCGYVSTTLIEEASTGGRITNLYKYQFVCAKSHSAINMQFQMMKYPDTIKVTQ